jgi:hypothetical protein
VRVELLSKQERDEPDQRQCGGDEANDDERAGACVPSKRYSPTRTHATHFAQHVRIGFPHRQGEVRLGGADFARWA